MRKQLVIDPCASKRPSGARPYVIRPSVIWPSVIIGGPVAIVTSRRRDQSPLWPTLCAPLTHPFSSQRPDVFSRSLSAAFPFFFIYPNRLSLSLSKFSSDI